MEAKLDADVLKEIENAFSERYRPPEPGTPATVAPTSTEEVATLAEIAGRHKLPLALRGAGTALEQPSRGLLVRFEHMRRVSIPEQHDVVELEPGIPWVELEDHLRVSGKSLRIYPTSAPHSTVGGWLARDGLGVGSHDFAGYGRMWSPSRRIRDRAEPLGGRPRGGHPAAVQERGAPEFDPLGAAL